MLKCLRSINRNQDVADFLLWRRGEVVFVLEWEHFVCYVILKGSLDLLFWFEKGFV